MSIQAPIQLDLFDLLESPEPSVEPYDDWARCAVVEGHCAGCGEELAPRNGWHAGINHAQVNRPDRYPAHVPVCVSMDLTLSHFISSLKLGEAGRAADAVRFDRTWSRWLKAGLEIARNEIGLVNL